MTATKTGPNNEMLISLPENYAATQDHYPVRAVRLAFFVDEVMQNNDRFSRHMPPVIITAISHGSGNVMAARARASFDFAVSKDK